jgi:hypothetical protein
MTNVELIFALAVIVAAVLAVTTYHFMVVAPALRSLRALLRVHDEALGGNAGAASGRLSSLEDGLSQLSGDHERVSLRIRELDDLARTDVSRIGFVRFDAFDTGAELSYALALLSREGDGVVVSSIYSRTDTRTFGKAVEGFRPLSEASEEELRAIAAARQSKV